MIKLVIVLYSMLFSPVAEELKHLRQEFQLVGKEERAVTSILTICKSSQSVDSRMLKVYEAAAKICSAKYQAGPMAKYRTFNAGKGLLDAAVANDSLNVEARYLRYTIQANAPAFLGYQKSLKSDRNYIISALPSLKQSDPHLYALIQAYFMVYEGGKPA
jgi:hypothetical protein